MPAAARAARRRVPSLVGEVLVARIVPDASFAAV